MNDDESAGPSSLFWLYARAVGDRHQRAGEALSELSRIMQALRAPDGCPWDREQTLETLKSYLVEETYELLEAMDAPVEHREELGDVLLQVVFQSEIRAESGEFSLADVVLAVSDKLRRRHPHVFGSTAARSVNDTIENWESIKAKERKKRGAPSGRLSGVPRSAPSLLRAFRVGQKAAATGFDWPELQGAREKLDEELRELDEAIADGDREQLFDELGDVLFATCNLARHLEIDPDQALRQAIAKFERRFGVIEKELDRAGETFEQASLDRLEALWKIAKRQENAL